MGSIYLLFLLFIVLMYGCEDSPGKDPSVRAPAAPAAPLAPLIENRISGWKSPSKVVVGEEQVYAAVLVKNFYKERSFEPAWFHDGRLMQADALVKAVQEAYGDGLTPEYYHLGPIKALAGEAAKGRLNDTTRMVDLEMLLTDAFLTLGCHLSGGCVNPVTIESKWFAKQGSVDISSVLKQAMTKRQIRESLAALRPDQGSYGRLKNALARYRGMASRGEWPAVSPGAALKKGTTSDRVVELRKRLIASSDLEAEGIKEGPLFDDKLEQAVIAFQKRHGLKADGVVGPAALKVLSVPLKQRIRQIELNMERMRWVFGIHEQRAVVVNIADFELNVVENWKPVLSMKVVVGKPYRRTPIFTSKLTHILINPPWNVPDSIARDEILRLIKKDPNYLVEQNIKVLSGWGPQEKEIDPETLDWSRINARNWVYRLRQEPGPQNPLGRLKFDLPNKYDVYLHDTSSRRLFSQDMRAFSHGCTRVEKPLDLAVYLLKGDPEWTREKLLAAIETGKERRISVPQPLNVHFLYLTAWVDESGVLQFRDDIYKRDNLLDEALHKKPSFN